MTTSPLTKRNNLILLLILVVAFILRFYRLALDSFWVDELHTLNEADPNITIKEMFGYLRTLDQHPPLWFFCERVVFFLFGRSEFIARVPSALAGVASVYVLYLLGKEILNKNLGLIAAAITCVNHFDIYYSREARDYSFLFLFGALSLLFLIRLIKHLRAKDMWWYSVASLLLMYSHYFGIFMEIAEFAAAFVFWFASKDKPLYLKRFLISGVVIAIGYSIWVPFVLTMSHISSFWITPIPKDFLFTYFDAYFGNNKIFLGFIFVLLAYYLIAVYGKKEPRWPDTTNNPFKFTFIVFFICLVITYGIPYVRSLLTVPMLTDRYTIELLPIFLLMLAIGIELIPNKWVKVAVLVLFLGISMRNLVFGYRMYTRVHKTQFRECMAFMNSDTTARKYPILNDRTYWQFQYYVTQSGYPGPLISTPRDLVLDSVINQSSPRYKVDGFWLMDAHDPKKPDAFLNPKMRSRVDSAFFVEKQILLYDSWVQLYKRRPTADSSAKK